MTEYVVIHKQKITSKDQLDNKAVMLWKNEDTLEESSQRVLRISSNNEAQFRDYIKYSNDEIGAARLAMVSLQEQNDMPLNNMPFASKKIMVNGEYKSLFKRVHGISATVNAGATMDIDFIIPYPVAKFTGAEIFGVDLKDILNFYVLDDATNTYSGAPGSNYTLNQFGFNVEMPPGGVYQNTSNYDADIYYGMVIRCQYTNNGVANKYIAMNPWLHEVK